MDDGALFQSLSVLAVSVMQSGVGHEFECQIVVLLLQLPLSSCVVSDACTIHNVLKGIWALKFDIRHRLTLQR